MNSCFMSADEFEFMLSPLGAVAQSSERSAKNKARKPVKKNKKNKLFTYYLNILRCNLALSLPDR